MSKFAGLPPTRRVVCQLPGRSELTKFPVYLYHFPTSAPENEEKKLPLAKEEDAGALSGERPVAEDKCS